jgi:hypothetical protein
VKGCFRRNASICVRGRVLVRATFGAGARSFSDVFAHRINQHVTWSRLLPAAHRLFGIEESRRGGSGRLACREKHEEVGGEDHRRTPSSDADLLNFDPLERFTREVLLALLLLPRNPAGTIFPDYFPLEGVVRYPDKGCVLQAGLEKRPQSPRRNVPRYK